MASGRCARALGTLVLTLVLGSLGRAHYTSDQCSWRGSGLTHEAHARDVEQVYLRCSQGSLEWLYPTGAIIVNLRPNTPAARPLSVCLKPLHESSGSNIYLDRTGELRLLLPEDEQALGRVHCFGIQEGVLFIEAVPHRDISRRITAFQYELVNDRQGPDLSFHNGPCQACSDQEILIAVCTSDFVVRGKILAVDQEAGQLSLTVGLHWLYRQKSQVFASGGGRIRHWMGKIRAISHCSVQPWEGEYMFTGTVRFGEAWLGCAMHFKDFLKLYTEALQLGTNPCQVDTG